MTTGIPILKENIGSKCILIPQGRLIFKRFETFTACQQLLKDRDCRTSSWLRKQSFRNKLQLFRWPQVFVVLCDGCVYYYRNETAKTPSGSFCLYGYNSVLRATEIPTSEAPWAFKIVHTFKEYKTYLFSASSEAEMKDWMKMVKKELKHANNKNIRSAGDGQDGDDVSQTYQEIETKIYEDPAEFVVPKDYKNRRNDDFTDDDDIYRSRGPVAPPVPPREREGGRGKKGATMHAPRNTVSDLTSDLNKKLDLSKQEKAVAQAHGRTRGAPDGASVKKKVSQVEVYQDASSAQNDEEEKLDPEKYWAAIHFLSSEREKSSEIIRTLGEDGVYLVRDSSSPGEKVLVVFAGDMPRKFKIMWQDNHSFLNSKKDVRYPSLEELLHHYYDVPLPGYTVSLSQPYKLHPKFKPSMLQ